jgi:hypothetical protein
MATDSDETVRLLRNIVRILVAIKDDVRQLRNREASQPERMSRELDRAAAAMQAWPTI